MWLRSGIPMLSHSSLKPFLIILKRYLTAVDALYYDELSEASKQSLRFQGGPFEGEALERFEKDGLRDEMVRLRRWDDGAKIVGVEDVTPRAGRYKEMMRRHLEGQEAS